MPTGAGAQDIHQNNLFNHYPAGGQNPGVSVVAKTDARAGAVRFN